MGAGQLRPILDRARGDAAAGPLEKLGAAGVVFVLNRSFAGLEDNYLPFYSGYEPLPALFVDRDTGQLREAASTRPRATLTLTATRAQSTIGSVTAVIPGRSDETIILNTHTDGQGFVEENGAVAFVQLARHFASLGSTMPTEDTSTPGACGPANRFVADAGRGRALAVRWAGARPDGRAALVDLAATGAPVGKVVVELRRGGRAVARARAGRVARASRRVQVLSLIHI